MMILARMIRIDAGYSMTLETSVWIWNLKGIFTESSYLTPMHDSRRHLSGKYVWIFHICGQDLKLYQSHLELLFGIILYLWITVWIFRPYYLAVWYRDSLITNLTKLYFNTIPNVGLHKIWSYKFKLLQNCN